MAVELRGLNDIGGCCGLVPSRESLLEQIYQALQKFSSCNYGSCSATESSSLRSIKHLWNSSCLLVGSAMSIGINECIKADYQKNQVGVQTIKNIDATGHLRRRNSWFGDGPFSAASKDFIPRSVHVSRLVHLRPLPGGCLICKSCSGLHGLRRLDDSLRSIGL